MTKITVTGKSEHEIYIHNLYERICGRLRHIGKSYPDVVLSDCVIIGNEESDWFGGKISNIPYIYCATISDFKLGNCKNFKACRDFEDGFGEDTATVWNKEVNK